MNQPTTNPILDSRGKPATAGSVVKGNTESYKIKQCGDCGGAVAWVKSSKGKWYLANARPTRAGSWSGPVGGDGIAREGWRVYNFEPHFKDCGQFIASQESADIRREVDRRMNADEETTAKWFLARTPDGKTDYSVKEAMEAEFEAQVRAEMETAKEAK